MSDFVASVRSFDGGWHHARIQSCDILPYIATYVGWSECLDSDTQSGRSGNTLKLAIVVDTASSNAPDRINLNWTRSEPVPRAVFTPAAATLWNAAGLPTIAGHTSDLQPKLHLVDLRPLCTNQVPREIRRIQEESLEVARSWPNRFDVSWKQAREHARSVWKRIMPTLPFERFGDARLLIPGMLAFAGTKIGTTTVRDLISAGGRWNVRRIDRHTANIVQPTLRELQNELVHTIEGKRAFEILSAMGATCFDTVCLLERHLAHDERRAVGDAIDRLCMASNRCVTLSPVTRSSVIEDMELSARANSFATKFGSIRYGDLVPFMYGLRVALVSPDKCDVESARSEFVRVADQISARAAKDPRATQAHSVRKTTPANHATTLIDAFSSDFLSLSETQASVIRSRFGIHAKPETLETLADKLSVTRERIRQIEQRSLSKMYYIRQVFDRIIEELIDRIRQRESPILSYEFSGMSPEVTSVLSCEYAFRRLIKMWASGVLQTIDVANGGFAVMSATTVNIEDIRYKVHRYITHDRSPSFDLVDKLTGMPLLKAQTGDVLRAFVLSVSDPSGPYGDLIKPKPPTGNVLVHAELSASSAPMSVQQLVEQIHLKFKRRLPKRLVHANLVRKAFPFGNQVYGLEQHLRIDPESARELAQQVDKLVTASTESEWRIKAIRALLERSACEESVAKLSDFELAAVLRLHSRVLNYGRRLAFTKSSARLTFGLHASLDALVEIGEPASSSSISQRVEERLPGITFQVRPTMRMARVAKGKWGLRGRDFEISDTSLHGIFDWIQVRLRTNTFVHHEELHECNDYLDARNSCSRLCTLTIADLAHASRRFRCVEGGNITLRYPRHS